MAYTSFPMQKVPEARMADVGARRPRLDIEHYEFMISSFARLRFQRITNHDCLFVPGTSGSLQDHDIGLDIFLIRVIIDLGIFEIHEPHGETYQGRSTASSAFLRLPSFVRLGRESCALFIFLLLALLHPSSLSSLLNCIFFAGPSIYSSRRTIRTHGKSSSGLE